MNIHTAWSLYIAGFTGTAFARRVARHFRAGPIAAVRFARGERITAPFEEYFVGQCDPHEALAAIAAAQPLPRHFLAVLADRPGLREIYERAGYQPDDAETLMACDLAAMPAPNLGQRVTLVRPEEGADWYNAHDPEGLTWIMPDNLADPHMAHYAITDNGQLLARGRNLWIDAQHSYVTRVYTAEAWRGQGLARALMARLLADDIARGARWSVLTATSMGAPLYARFGYRPLGTLLFFQPAQS